MCGACAVCSLVCVCVCVAGPHLVVDLLTVLEGGGQQGQQAVGAPAVRLHAQVGQGFAAPRLDVGQGACGALEGRGAGERETSGIRPAGDRKSVV